MTREELREHCEKQISACEMWAHSQGERPCGKVYEEHSLILELLKYEPDIGHWVFKDVEDQTCSIYTCDKCGEQICIYDDTIKSPQEGHYNFCPNCGCRMIDLQERD